MGMNNKEKGTENSDIKNRKWNRSGRGRRRGRARDLGRGYKLSGWVRGKEEGYGEE